MIETIFPEEVKALLGRIRSNKDRHSVARWAMEAATSRSALFASAAFDTSRSPVAALTVFLEVAGQNIFVVRGEDFDAHAEVVQWLASRLLQRGSWLAGQRLHSPRWLAISENDFTEFKLRFDGPRLRIARPAEVAEGTAKL